MGTWFEADLGSDVLARHFVQGPVSPFGAHGRRRRRGTAMCAGDGRVVFDVEALVTLGSLRPDDDWYTPPYAERPVMRLGIDRFEVTAVEAPRRGELGLG